MNLAQRPTTQPSGFLARRLVSLTNARGTALAFFALLAAYLVWHVAVFSALPADDAYIHMRIARNFVEYGVPYFNPGQAVAGSSSVVWLLLVSGLFWLVGPEPQYVAILAMLSIVGLFWACSVLLTAYYPRLGAIGVAFVLTTITALSSAAMLMETPTALFFWASSLLLLRRRAWITAGVFVGLAAATRYELVLWAMLAMLLADTARDKLRLVAGAAPIGIALGTFNYYYFNSFVPQTIKAKSVVYSISITEFLSQAGLPTIAPLLGAIVILFCFVACYLHKHRHQKSMYFSGLFGIFLLTLYALRSVLIFPWYIPLFLLPILLTVACMLCIHRRVIRLAALMLLLYFGIHPAVIAAQEMRGVMQNDLRSTTLYYINLRARQYQTIGADLAREFPSAALMTPEIGGLGWTFRGRIIDAVGLVSPECLQYHPLTIPQDRAHGYVGAIPPQAVRDLQPDIVVAMEGFSGAVRRDMAHGTINGYRLYRAYPVLPTQDLPNHQPVKLWDSAVTQVFIRTTSLHDSTKP